MKLFNSCIIQQSFEQSPLPLQQPSKPPPQQLAATHIGMQMNAIGGNTPPRPQRPHKQHAEEQQGFDLDRFLRQKKPWNISTSDRFYNSKKFLEIN